MNSKSKIAAAFLGIYGFIWEETSHADAISAARAPIEYDTHAQRSKEVTQ